MDKHEEASIENAIQAAGLTAPRVTPADIDILMADVTYAVVQQPDGTTSTFVHAYLDGKFFLGSGFSACVSPENFNAQIGATIAHGKAEAAARDKLWELQGYLLYTSSRKASQAVSPDGEIIANEKAEEAAAAVQA